MSDNIKIDKQDFMVVDALLRDAGEAAFFLRELEHVKSETYDTKYKQLKAMSLLPIDASADEGAAIITYQKFTKVGIAKIIIDYADDAPRSDIYGEEVSVRVYRIGVSYGYDRDEIARSRLARRNLDRRRADSAKRANDEKVNTIAWNGDSAHNIQGFINYPGITEYTIPNGGSGDSEWNTKTPDEIIADMAGIVTGVIDSTNGIEVPDTMLLPIEQYEYISNTRMTDGDSKTIMRYFLDNNPHIKMIDWLTELKGAGVGGSDRMMVYPKNPRNVTLEMPMPFRQLPPQQDGYGFKILCHSKTAGVIVYYPLSVSYADGI